jgi:hypothetical protein
MLVGLFIGRLAQELSLAIHLAAPPIWILGGWTFSYSKDLRLEISCERFEISQRVFLLNLFFFLKVFVFILSNFPCFNFEHLFDDVLHLALNSLFIECFLLDLNNIES